RRVRFFFAAVFVEHADFTDRIRVFDLNTKLLFRYRLLALAEGIELREEAALGLGAFVIGIRIDVAHEINAFGAVAVFDCKPDAIECQADAPPRTIELVVHRKHAAAGLAFDERRARGALRLRLRDLGLRALLLDAESRHQ